jgi:hypothetical protein
MERFAFKAALLALPFCLWAVCVVVVDPFDYFNVSHVIAPETKVHNAQQINTLYYHAFQEANDPSPNVLIGDSRTASLPIDEINRLTGARYRLLTASALKINEITDLFWLANRYHKLENVYVGVNFSMFNAYAYADRVTAVRTILDNPFRYVFNLNTAQALFYVVESAATDKPAVSSVPPMTRDEFWEYMIKVRGTDWYGKYQFPDTAYDQMKKMVEYCRANGVNLTFIIVPHHVEFQNRVWDYHLSRDKARFLKAMLDLDARVIDYDYINDITLRKSNFTDPVHYNEAIGKLIANEVWTGKFNIGRVIDPTYVESISVNELIGRKPDALAAFPEGHSATGGF